MQTQAEWWRPRKGSEGQAQNRGAWGGAAKWLQECLGHRVVVSWHVAGAGSTGLKNSFFHDTDGKVTFILVPILFFLLKDLFHPRRATQSSASSPALGRAQLPPGTPKHYS